MSKGCVLAGCGVVTAVGVIIAAVAGYFMYSMYSTAKSFTSETPMEVRVHNPSEEQVERVDQKIKQLNEAIKSSKSIKMTFSEDELNALIASRKDIRENVGNFAVEMEGDTLTAEGSIPLKDFPLLEGRYLNGVFTIHVGMEYGRLDIKPESIVVNGKPVPEDLMVSLRQTNLADQMYNNPEQAKYVGALKSVDIQNGTLIVETRDEPPSGTPSK